MIAELVCLSRGSEQRVRLRCDNCGVITSSTYANYFRGQEKRGHSGVTFCRPCSSKLFPRKTGLPAWNRGLKLPHMRGKNHPRWKGGRYVSNDGYIITQVKSGRDPDEPAWRQYKREHKHIMEQHVGRELTNSESVHHIDGDKQNNDLGNLFLTDQRGHRAAHQSLQEIGYQLFRAGLITFRDGKYFCERSFFN